MPKHIDPPLYRRGDSPYWWTWTYDDRARVRVSTKCTDRTAALARARQIQREAADPGIRHAAETVGDALAVWFERPTNWAKNTVLMYGGRMMHVAEHLGRVQLARLSREHVEGYVTARLTKGSGRSVAAEVRILLDAVRLAKQRGRAVPDLELLRVKVARGAAAKDRWLTKPEVDALCAQLRPHRALWVRIAVYTGCRREELNTLRWDDIDWERRAIHVRGTKNRRSDRWVPLASPLIELLERTSAALRETSSAKLPGRPLQTAAAQILVGQPHPIGPLVARWKTNSTAGLDEPCRRAGILRCTAHDFRRTFASWLAQAGVPLPVVADLLGHSSTKLARTVYAHMSAAQYEAAIGKLT